MLNNPKECGERKKACPFFLLENSRPLSPWGPLDSLSTCLGTDSLKVKWALGSITKNKASGGDGIPVELFQILKDAAVKVLHSICEQIWKTQQ